MWNNLLKLTVVSWIWNRYRRTIIALPLLLLYVWLVNLIHDDVIAYATLNNDPSWLGWTFFLKWLFVLLGVGVFVMIHISGRQVQPEELDSLKVKMQSEPVSKTNKEDAASHTEPASESDGFEAIRHKNKLRSRADFILQNKED